MASGVRNPPVKLKQAPVYLEGQFSCPRCGVFSTQQWTSLYRRFNPGGGVRHIQLSDISMSQCLACSAKSLWFEKRLVVPEQSFVEALPEDLPAEFIRDFEEAAAISARSPRAAAALLRMCVEALCKDLAGRSKFDQAIGELERQGIPTEISIALDVVRSNGNEVLHAGKLYGDDDDHTVRMLFDIVRSIVNWAITQKRNLAQLYAEIPDTKRAASEERRRKSREAADGG
ncbi:uncharacterized protein DUF4145 [Hoeflea marina]|uniref:Uncharacterized protein DUF4145 n=2 Tax=Hoeflea marina TaxID=274592 RepID=A0A317PRW8_9HYPH|nr:uncharacterized protein DUF4145 [Hoeflea marina]